MVNCVHYSGALCSALCFVSGFIAVNVWTGSNPEKLIT